MNLARLNYILVPETKEEWERFRKSLAFRLYLPIHRVLRRFTLEGQLLLLTAVIVGSAGVQVRITQVHLLWCGLFGLVVATLAIRPWYALTDVRAEIRVPDRVTVGEPVAIQIILRNEGDRDHHALRVSRPLLSWDGTWLGEQGGIPSLPAGETVRFTVEARFAHRGQRYLPSLSIAPVVPLGFGFGDGIRTPDAHVMIVPEIVPILALETPIGQRYQPGGVALASKTGESMELLGVRAYRPGDPIRDLHARTWARVGWPVVREYQQEYFSRVGVILDTDRTAADEAHFEAAISLAAGAVAHFSRGEALIDLLVVGDQIHPLTLGRSLGTLDQALDLLACVEAGPTPDPESLATRLRPHLQRLSCLVVIALDWDERRRRFLHQVERQGIATRTFLVGEGMPSREVTPVSLAAIEETEGLNL